MELVVSGFYIAPVTTGNGCLLTSFRTSLYNPRHGRRIYCLFTMKLHPDLSGQVDKWRRCFTWSCWIHRTCYKRKLHSVHRILVSGLPGCSCAARRDCRLHAASCFAERERKWTLSIASTHLLGYTCCSFVRYKYTGVQYPFPNAYSEILTNTRKFYQLACLSVIDVLMMIAYLLRWPSS